MVLSAHGVFVEGLDPAADSEGDGGAVLGVLEHELAVGGPPVIAGVIECGKLDGGAVLGHTAGLVLEDLLVLSGDGRVGGVAADVLAPGGEAVGRAGHVGDEGAGGPGQRAVVGDEQVVAVAIAADAGVAVIVGRYRDVVLGDGGRLLNGAQLGVNQQAELVGGGLVDEGVADGAVVGLGVVAADPELYPGQGVLAVLAEAEVSRVGGHGVDGGLEVGLLLGGEGVKGLLEPCRVCIVRQHVEEVLADDLGVDVHEQTVLALSDEVPAVVVGLGAGVVEHEDLVQGLQRQIAGPLLGGGAVGLGPVLRDKGVEDAGLHHLALYLVAVLDERHGEGAGVLQGVGSQLVEDLVVLRLLPVVLKGVVRVNALQVLDEERERGLAAAGVADAEEGRAV